MSMLSTITIAIGCLLALALFALIVAGVAVVMFVGGLVLWALESILGG